MHTKYYFYDGDASVVDSTLLQARETPIRSFLSFKHNLITQMTTMGVFVYTIVFRTDRGMDATGKLRPFLLYLSRVLLWNHHICHIFNQLWPNISQALVLLWRTGRYLCEVYDSVYMGSESDKRQWCIRA